MRKFLWMVLWVMAGPVAASHIVGGEFELIHITGNTYRINLILYFDKANGLPGARDLNARVYLYRKIDRLPMTNILLPLTQDSPVAYTQPECSRGDLQTDKLVYTATITLSPALYNHPQGYYMVWERCCRNYNITNIFSQMPGSGIAAGQTFYLEFPPVVKNGEPFRNSSPRLFPPLSDYACPFKPYYVDFSGVDDDGDSLVYSLVTPLSTTSADALPPPTGGPYPPVTWRPGFGLNSILNGAPDLRITQDGLLTCTPTRQGLFVFAVKVDEFRDGVKIGEARRDFQMLVVESCADADPPRIVGRRLADAAFPFENTMSVSFPHTTPDNERCIVVRVSDPDASKPSNNFEEKIRLRIVGLNFRNETLNNLIDQPGVHVLQNGSTKDFTICFPQCPYFQGGPYQIGIIAQDDACALPLSDTLRVSVLVQPPPNVQPVFTPNVTATVQEGDDITWNWEVTDADGDALSIGVLTDGFLLADVGMTFTIAQQGPGFARGTLRWDSRCDVYDFTQRTAFRVTVLANDADPCNFSPPVPLVYTLNILLPGNADPIIQSNLTQNPDARLILNVQRKVHESLVFDVIGQDLIDRDYLVLEGYGLGFQLADYGISFPRQEGTAQLQSQFVWNINCENVNPAEKSVFDFRFLVIDAANKCRFYKADTLDVQVIVSPPDNRPPELELVSSDAALLPLGLEQNYVLGAPILFTLRATDADVSPTPDRLSVELVSATGNVAPAGYVFANRQGTSEVLAPFQWDPDCSVFEGGVYANEYVFSFRVTDDRCFVPAAQTLDVTIRLADVDGTDTAFLPPNVITPNGDGCNDYFALEGISDSPCGGVNADARIALPRDNCSGRFMWVRVYNRWGNVMFESRDRDFRWYAPEEASGVYFYSIKFTNREYKGSLSVRY